jgi:hypothetical protein
MEKSQETPIVDTELLKIELDKAQRHGLLTEKHHQVRSISDVVVGEDEEGQSYL